MPTWRNELPTVQKHMGFDLRRTPATGTIQAICTCDNILVCDTHFWHGRTLPCERPDCQACGQAIPYRTHVYVSAFDPRKAEHFLFECTAHAAKPLQEYHEANTTLRGCVFHASRPKGTKNSKVCIETNTANLKNVNLPQSPNLILALSVIWRLPLTGLAIEHEQFRQPKVETKAKPLHEMREQEDNQPDPPTIGDIIDGNGQLKAQESHA